MAKNITVIGTGYVGLVAAVGLSDFGNTVIGADIDNEKVEKLNRGIPVIYEVGLKEYLGRNLEAGRLTFTTDIAGAVRKADVIFIAVGTPPKQDGGADLSFIDSVISTIAANVNGYKVIVTKSTVPVGTNRWVKEEIIKRKENGNEFDVVSNPEFLREGKAVQDFFHPDRIVVGFESERAKEMMEDIYRSLYINQTPFLWCSLETAELIKYASNAFLATKIMYINQMANLAEAVGADIHQIAKAMGMDGRISSKFLHPGPGYGGSCFPKDTKAVAGTGDACGEDMSLIKEVIRANEAQKRRMGEKVKRLLGGSLRGKTVAVLGLAFKAETDDVRESPAIEIVTFLLQEGAAVRAHDPEAMENFAKEINAQGTGKDTITYFADAYDALEGACALVICTEWNEYRNIDLKRAADAMAGETMKEKVILDTRNLLEPGDVKDLGFTYEGVGRK